MPRRPDNAWYAGLFMAQPPPAAGTGSSGAELAGRGVGQALPDTMEQFKQMVSEAVATGISEGARRVESRYSTVATVVVAALVVTAAATATVAILSLLRD